MTNECNALHPDGIHHCELQAFHRGMHRYYIDHFNKIEWTALDDYR